MTNGFVLRFAGVKTRSRMTLIIFCVRCTYWMSVVYSPGFLAIRQRILRNCQEQPACLGITKNYLYTLPFCFRGMPLLCSNSANSLNFPQVAVPRTILKQHLLVVLEDGCTLECMNRFCYLGDMLGAAGSYEEAPRSPRSLGTVQRVYRVAD